VTASACSATPARRVHASTRSRCNHVNPAVEQRHAAKVEVQVPEIDAILLALHRLAQVDRDAEPDLDKRLPSLLSEAYRRVGAHEDFRHRHPEAGP
jgi:hypothetical protein